LGHSSLILLAAIVRAPQVGSTCALYGTLAAFKAKIGAGIPGPSPLAALPSDLDILQPRARADHHAAAHPGEGSLSFGRRRGEADRVPPDRFAGADADDGFGRAVARRDVEADPLGREAGEASVPGRPVPCNPRRNAGAGKP